jgi:ferredoxin
MKKLSSKGSKLLGNQQTANGRDCVLHYCARAPERAALLHRLENPLFKGKVKLHFDAGDPSKGLDLTGLLREQEAGAHLYYCGPAGFMKAVGQAAAHWLPGTVHSEYFVAPEATLHTEIADAFEVQMGHGGPVYSVTPDKSIVQVLRDNGVRCETSCEAGLCGSCKTRCLEGEPDHRDMVLSSGERKDWVIICCARSKSKRLVLDVSP